MGSLSGHKPEPWSGVDCMGRGRAELWYYGLASWVVSRVVATVAPCEGSNVNGKGRCTMHRPFSISKYTIFVCRQLLRGILPLVGLHESSQASGLFERHPTIDHAGEGSTSATERSLANVASPD